MALNFAAASTDRVNHGTGAAGFTSCSLCMWVYPTGLSFNALFSVGSPVNIPELAVSSDELRVRWTRATTNLAYDTNNANLTTNKWWFIGLTLDQGAGAGELANIYLGDLTTLATERTYASPSDGSGAFTSNSGATIFIGNTVSPFDSPWEGRIASCLFWPGVVLTAAQFQLQQFRFAPIIAGAQVASVYGYNGTGTQPDWSGNANSGTVTGATVGDHVPLSFRRRGSVYVPYTVPTTTDETIWQLTELTTPALVDLLAVVDDPSGTPITKKLALSDFVSTLALSNTVVQVKTVGSGTYTPTSGMKKVLAIAVGSGGGGAGGINTDSAGGGGGGGGTVIRLMTAADIGASKAYVVGAGGAAASNGNATTLDGGTLMNAGGGSAGTAGAGSTTLGTQAAGGAGGSAANGNLNIPGEPGDRGLIFDGTNGYGGAGGGSQFGFGGASSGTNTAGNNGAAYGGGGGGGHASGTANRDGGAGADGILYLIEFMG